MYKDTSDDYKEMLKEEKSEKNNTVNKIKSLFNKIKNFEQLKGEVFEMKKTFQKTFDDVKNMKEDYSIVNDKVKDINKFIGVTSSFEQIQEDTDFKNLMKKKIEEFDNKLEVVLGDFEMNKFNQEDSDDNNNENEKNKRKSRSNKILNLIELNKRFNHYQQSKVNTNDFELKNQEYKNRIDEINDKLDDILTSLFGNIDEETKQNGDYISEKNLLFATKNEFEKFKTKTDEEIDKIWEKLKELNKQYEEIFAKIKDDCTINDLEETKNLILEKTQELFLNMKNKNIDNTAVENLQIKFNKLLKLLADKEEQEKWLLAKKPVGGYTCASCEKYLGSLKDDTNKHINWKKLPIKIKNKELNNKIYKIGNGYSRLLRMINFDNNGIPTLNPFDYMNDYMYSSSSNMNENNKSKDNELNKSSFNKTSRNITSKYFFKEKSENNNLKTRNEKKLPNINASNSTDNLEKSPKKVDPSMSSFNFISPRLTNNPRKRYYKFDL